jgi:hypothetical protein
MKAWPLYFSSRVAKVTISFPPRPTAIFGLASGPSSSDSSVFDSVTAGPKDFARSLDLATETRPPAAQVSQSVPSGANEADALVAQRSSGLSQGALGCALMLVRMSHFRARRATRDEKHGTRQPWQDLARDDCHQKLILKPAK